MKRHADRVSPKDINGAISLLRQDEVRYANMICFMRNYPIESIERVGDSLIVRGVSDRRWVYVSSPSQQQLDAVAGRLRDEDCCFAAVEDWMVPSIIRGRKIGWLLSMVKFILPEDVACPQPSRFHIGPLSASDAEGIYEASIYKAFTSPEYIRDRIERGVSAGIHEAGKLVAWIMTHDDCSIGVMHVLDDHRGRGYAHELTVYLVNELRRRGRIPFVHIEERNEQALSVVRGIGFVKGGKISWFELTP